MSGLMLRLFAWIARPLSYVLDGFVVLSREGAKQPCAGIETNPGTGTHNMMILGLPA